MSEVVFQVRSAPGGGFTARAVGHCMFVQAASLAELETHAREAVACQLEDGAPPRAVRIVHENETIRPDEPEANGSSSPRHHDIFLNRSINDND